MRGSGIKAGGRTGITFSTNGILAVVDVSTKTNKIDRLQDVGRGKFDGLLNIFIRPIPGMLK